MPAFKTIITEEKIQKRIAELAEKINEAYAGKTLDIIYFTSSSSMFCADLIRQLRIETRIHPLGFSNYPKANVSGEVRITLDVAEPLQSRHVLVLEGIVVSGRTPRFILDLIQLRQPESLVMCALGVKPEQLSVSLPLKYIAFELGSEILVGYGIGSGQAKALSDLSIEVQA